MLKMFLLLMFILSNLFRNKFTYTIFVILLVKQVLFYIDYLHCCNIFLKAINNLNYLSSSFYLADYVDPTRYSLSVTFNNKQWITETIQSRLKHNLDFNLLQTEYLLKGYVFHFH